MPERELVEPGHQETLASRPGVVPPVVPQVKSIVEPEAAREIACFSSISCRRVRSIREVLGPIIGGLQKESSGHPMLELQLQRLIVGECGIFLRKDCAVLGIGFDAGSVGRRMTLILIIAYGKAIAIFSNVAAARGPGTQE